MLEVVVEELIHQEQTLEVVDQVLVVLVETVLNQDHRQLLARVVEAAEVLIVRTVDLVVPVS
jgi:hypothetical protein